MKVIDIVDEKYKHHDSDNNEKMEYQIDRADKKMTYQRTDKTLQS